MDKGKVQAKAVAALERRFGQGANGYQFIWFAERSVKVIDLETGSWIKLTQPEHKRAKVIAEYDGSQL